MELLADVTGPLGLSYDDAHRGSGMRIAEVIEGDPADHAGSALLPGAVSDGAGQRSVSTAATVAAGSSGGRP